MKTILILSLVLILFILYKNYKSEFGSTTKPPEQIQNETQNNKEKIITNYISIISGDLQMNNKYTINIKKSNDTVNSKKIQDSSYNAQKITYTKAVTEIQGMLKAISNKKLSETDKLRKATYERNIIDLNKYIECLDKSINNKIADTVRDSIPVQEKQILTNNKNIIINSKLLFDKIMEYSFNDKYNYIIQSLDNGSYIKNDRTLINNGNKISNGNVLSNDINTIFNIIPKDLSKKLYTINNLNLDSSLNLVSKGNTQWYILPSEIYGFSIYYNINDKPNYLSVSPTGKLGIAVRPYYWIINIKINPNFKGSTNPTTNPTTIPTINLFPDNQLRTDLEKVFKQDDYSMGWSSSFLEKRRIDWDGPGAIAYSPAQGDVHNPNTGTLVTNFTVKEGSVYQINMSVGDLTIYHSGNPVNKGPITLASWIGNFVGSDLNTLVKPQSITILPGGPNIQWDLKFNLKIWRGGLLSFIVKVTDLSDKLAIKYCKVKLLK